MVERRYFVVGDVGVLGIEVEAFLDDALVIAV
jgi:hypothetical protein